MSTHFYAFGSICRGEIDKSSDVDLLACVSEPNTKIEPSRFSIYSHERIKELWLEGNPFAWHLHLESKLLYSSDGNDFIYDLGKPEPYKNRVEDCEKFRFLFSKSHASLIGESNSLTFDISCMFLAIRNFATCYSLGSDIPIFSRYSPLMIDNKIPITKEQYDIYVRARVLSTRGIGDPLSENDINSVLNSAFSIEDWMKKLSNTYLKLRLLHE